MENLNNGLMFMSEKYQFRSFIAEHLQNFIDEKRSLGFKYHTGELLLIRFDKYCIEHKLSSFEITNDFLLDWCKQSDTEKISNLNSRIVIVRQFLLYMAIHGYNVYIPKITQRPERILPHIFTEQERLEFFKELDLYVPNKNNKAMKRLANEYKVFFRILYCCGLRNSECCNIKIEDIDFNKCIIRILDAKNNKDRLVYISDDLNILCINYLEYLYNELNFKPIWFFPARDPNMPLGNSTVEGIFDFLWNKTESSKYSNKKPRVHDFRFTYVTDRINEWVSAGINVDNMMPYLQKFLGHKKIDDTYYYYSISRQLFNTIKILDKTGPDIIP